MVFDSSLRTNFHPISLTRPTFDISIGTGTLLTRIEDRMGMKATNLFVPPYLQDVTRENHHGADVNSDIPGKCLIVNSLIGDKPNIWNAIEHMLEEKTEKVYVDAARIPVYGIQDGLLAEQIDKSLRSPSKTKILSSDLNEVSLIRYPWTLMEQNESAIVSDFKRRYSDRPEAQGDFESRGSKFSISNMADIERYVTLDARNGPIIIEEGAQVQSFSHVSGPCFIGKGAVVKSAKIREGSSIGNYCRISGEVEQTIMSAYTNKNHEGYIGHSLIGSWINFGALTTTSDLKNTYGEIKMNVNGKRINTGNKKLGALVGDMVKTAIGTLISSGKKIGVSSFAFGNVFEDIPSFTMRSGSRSRGVETYVDSAIETQRQMMSRRGVTISKAYVAMIKEVFRLTRHERALSKVTKRKFRIEA